MDKIKGSDFHELAYGLKWLIAFRAIFATVLLFSTFIFCTSENLSHHIQPFLSLYGIAGFIIILTLVYSIMLASLKSRLYAFAYFQLLADVCLVTAIIFITGSFASIFTFLYMVCIIGASMLLFRKGSMIIAAVCSIQYGVLVDLEYYELASPFGYGNLSATVEWTHIIYRIVIIMAACFAVAFLSGLLALQARRAKQDLTIAKGHLKRVERMAAMGELAAGMAHEIKNPLASLSGSIQLLKEGCDPESSQHRLMQIVIRETGRLSDLVTEFLLFAKPQTGNAVTMRLDKEVEETIHLFKQDAVLTEQLEISFDHDRPAWIEMDPGHCRQILWNLLKNAAESIRGTGKIHLELSHSWGDKVSLKISDSGCGISNDVMASIFDPFFTTKSNGTGLGLSIIHRLIDSYQGMIDLESEPDKGSVFTLILPCVEPQQNLDT